MSSVIGGVLQVGLWQPDPTGKHWWPPCQLHHAAGHDPLPGKIRGGLDVRYRGAKRKQFPLPGTDGRLMEPYDG